MPNYMTNSYLDCFCPVLCIVHVVLAAVTVAGLTTKLTIGKTVTVPEQKTTKTHTPKKTLTKIQL